jgi:hypothetical protein
MKDAADLVSAIAQLLWPGVALTVVLLFRKELAGAIRRFRKGKILGNEVELGDELAALERQVVEVVAETPRLLPAPQGQPSTGSLETGKRSGPLVEGRAAPVAGRPGKPSVSVLEIPADPRDLTLPFEPSPEGLIALSALIERAMRRHLAATGWRGHNPMTPLPCCLHPRSFDAATNGRGGVRGRLLEDSESDRARP